MQRINRTQTHAAFKQASYPRSRAARTLNTQHAMHSHTHCRNLRMLLRFSTILYRVNIAAKSSVIPQGVSVDR